MMASLNQTSQKAVLEAIQDAVPDLIAVYQFGSTVQGESTPRATSILPFWPGPHSPT